MNLPNKLTTLRVIMIPFFVVFMLADMGRTGDYIALALFCLASLTDFFDGYLARKRIIWLRISASLWIRWRISCW